MPTTIKHPRHGRRGSIALAALTALVVVFIIGLGLLTLGSNARLSARHAMRLNGAQAMAAAGVEYGYWQRVYNALALPYTGSRTLGGGSFTVTVTDNSANIAGTIQVVSTGTQGRDSVKLTRILAVKKTVFDYALCSNSNVSTSQSVTTGAGSANGNTRVNGNLTLTNLTSVINGDATATGSILAFNTTGTTTTNGPAMTFPAINLSYYQGIATATYTGNQTFTGTFTLPPASGGFYPIFVVNGNLTLGTGTVSGIGTVIVSGTVTITGNFSYANPTSRLAVLCLGNIVNGAAAGTSISTVGYLYAHNSGGTAAFQQGNAGILTVTGGVAADTFSVTGPLALRHDPAMDGMLGSQMRLPGY